MRPHPATVVVLALLLGGAGAIGVMTLGDGGSAPGGAGEAGPVAVAVRVAEVESGTIRDVRTLSGTLEASSRFIVAAKAAGFLEAISVDISDPIEPGQVIAQIDDRRFVQDIAQARAELAVREAERTRSQSRLEVALAEFGRERRLREEGVSSESEFDAAQAEYEAARAERSVADARVEQARAALELANIRRDETRVRVDRAETSVNAVVAQRYEESGNTVGVGDPIIAAVVIDPIRAVVSVTERDYTRLRPGQAVVLDADAVPGRVFDGAIARISPVFSEASRQARIEIAVPNPDGLLKPGMFARVRIVLEERDAHTIVPAQAIRVRDGADVVFALSDEGGGTVREIPVTIGIRDADRVEILEPRLDAPVVTLGQQLLDDGSPVNIADDSGLAGPDPGPPATGGDGAAP